MKTNRVGRFRLLPATKRSAPLSFLTGDMALLAQLLYQQTITIAIKTIDLYL